MASIYRTASSTHLPRVWCCFSGHDINSLRMMYFWEKWYHQKVLFISSFQWMVMSVGFDNLKTFWAISVSCPWRQKLPSVNQWYHMKACLNTFQIRTNVMEFQSSRKITKNFCILILVTKGLTIMQWMCMLFRVDLKMYVMPKKKLF
jgi:hypothetical protein